jgi:hypothetical protein
VVVRLGVQALARLHPVQVHSQPFTEMLVAVVLLVRREAVVAVALGRQEHMLVLAVTVTLGQLTVSPMLAAAVAAHQVAAVVLRAVLAVAVAVQMAAATQAVMLPSTAVAVAVQGLLAGIAQPSLLMAVTAIKAL